MFLLRNLPTDVIFGLGLMIIIATVFAFIARLFKQPLIPAYVLTGVLLGPLVFGVLGDIDFMKTLSQLGIAFLLFVVGLDIDLKKLKEVGLVAIVGGIVQVLVIFAIGFYVASALGFSNEMALLLGVAIAFSSTMIVVKLLSDMNSLDTLHGRIILGILLMQDFIAMLIIPLFLEKVPSVSASIFIIIIIKILLMVLIALLCYMFLFPRLFRFAAMSKELLFLASITACFLFVILAMVLNVFVALGAFIVGITIGNLPYSVDVKGRIEPLKDFFATIFFVSLGAQLVFAGLGQFVELLLIFLALTLIVKPVVVFLILSVFGYSSQVSFLSAASLAQVSEFSLILVGSGLIYGNVSQEIFSLVVMLTIISMILTSYIMKHMHTLYALQSGFLVYFEKLAIGSRKKLEYGTKQGRKNIILIGSSRMGMIFTETLRKLHQNLIVIDNNPEVIRNLIEKKISCSYGDATSRTVLDNLDLKNIKILISTIPSYEENQFILNYVKSINPNITMIVTANYIRDCFRLYDLGADYVIVPRIISGERISEILPNIVKSRKELVALRHQHLQYMEELIALGLQ